MAGSDVTGYHRSFRAFLPFSMLAIHSLPGIFWWLALFCIFIFSQWVIRDKSALTGVSLALIFSALLIALHAVYFFIVIGLTSYPRLNSLIGLHNVYAAFLIMPLFLSIYFTYEAKTFWKRAAWIFSSSFLSANFILTFSRGAWLSAIVAIIVVVIVFNKQLLQYFRNYSANSDLKAHKDSRALQSKNVENTKITLGISRNNKTLSRHSSGDFLTSKFLMALSIIALTAIISLGIWQAAKLSAKIQSAGSSSNTASSNSTDIFVNENNDENAFTSRVAYFKDALTVFAQKPIVGFGLGNYQEALDNIKTDPAFYGSDPHNYFLKSLAEQGIIITGLFVAFLIVLFVNIWQLLRKQFLKLQPLKTQASANMLLPFFIITGLLASLIHICMDVDWKSPALTVIFFLFAAGTYSYLRTSNSSTPNKSAANMQNLKDSNLDHASTPIEADVKKFPSWLSSCIFVLMILSAMASLWLFLADNSRQDGDYLLGDRKPADALLDYNASVEKNPYEPLAWYGLSQAYIRLKNTPQSNYDIDQAIALDPNSSALYYWAARIAATESATSSIEDNLKRSIKHSPAMNLDAYVDLTALYISEKQYGLALNLINTIQPVYEKYQKSLWFKSDPSASSINFDIGLLTFYRAEIEDATKGITNKQ